MRGFGVVVTALLCSSCGYDQDLASSCEAMAEHRRSCGFTDDGVWCQEIARYRMTGAEREEIVCILACHEQATCEEITMDACAESRFNDTPVGACAESCQTLSDLLFVPAMAGECPTAPSD